MPALVGAYGASSYLVIAASFGAGPRVIAKLRTVIAVRGKLRGGRASGSSQAVKVVALEDYVFG